MMEALLATVIYTYFINQTYNNSKGSFKICSLGIELSTYVEKHKVWKEFVLSNIVGKYYQYLKVIIMKNYAKVINFIFSYMYKYINNIII